MNTEKLFKLLIFGLNNFNPITSVDRYTVETGHRRVTWYNNDNVGFKIDEENGCIDITSDKGVISIWKDELASVTVEGSKFPEIKVKCKHFTTVECDYDEYVIYGQ